LKFHFCMSCGEWCRWWWRRSQRVTRSLPIGPWPGLGVLAAYAGVAWLLGAASFTIRDA